MSAVTLHVWRVPAARVPAALVASRLTVRRLRRRREVSFAKVLGTASARFVPAAATPRRWAALTCWRNDAAELATWFDRHADERATLSLRPLSTRGTWDGHEPFGEIPRDRRASPAGPVLVLTRSTLRPGRMLAFYRAIPPIAAELSASPGCRVAFGIGEAPVRRQGTVSIWTSASAMTDFAHGSPRHRAAVDATAANRWYAEELFARFEVVAATGSIDGTAL